MQARSVLFLIAAIFGSSGFLGRDDPEPPPAGRRRGPILPPRFPGRRSRPVRDRSAEPVAVASRRGGDGKFRAVREYRPHFSEHPDGSAWPVVDHLAAQARYEHEFARAIGVVAAPFEATTCSRPGCRCSLCTMLLEHCPETPR